MKAIIVYYYHYCIIIIIIIIIMSQKLYVKVQGKMMHKDMHKIVFQSN
jgi:hypothetical protein